ncbi:probable ribosome-binding factor A, chloroplastic [Typha latifolia]|uniref:probable ribosome-binding factor A, chloroplastic n=1 Tax=Typha latifolia TaxID=4733 RepID=UPI003C2D0937
MQNIMLLHRPPSSPPLPLSSLHSTLIHGGLHLHFRLNLHPWRNPSTKGGPRRTGEVRCMANQRRVRMVAKQIQRELSDMLLKDKVLQYAVLPEASLGADRYLSSLTTISDVEVSGDLQVVKVYVSVFGDERGREVAIAGLKSKAKYVRSELGRRMKLRLTPEIRFIEDESLERGSRVLAILDRLKDEKNFAEGQDAEEPSEQSNVSEEDDWDKDEPDEGIVYVK